MFCNIFFHKLQEKPNYSGKFSNFSGLWNVAKCFFVSLELVLEIACFSISQCQNGEPIFQGLFYDCSQRKQRGYIFAKHYYKINEFESAEQYLSSFLTVDTENSAALKLMGQICLKLNKQDKALASFQKSLQLNPKQPDLITEVCQLLLADNNLNPSTANYWCNFAENEKVQNDAVFGLRLKIMENGLVKIFTFLMFANHFLIYL